MKLLSFQFLFVALTFASPTSVKGFSPQPLKCGLNPTTRATSKLSKLESSGNDDDGAKQWNPFNDGKKALVKMLAGEYDSPAVRAKLMGLIQDEPVLMLSFVK